MIFSRVSERLDWQLIGSATLIHDLGKPIGPKQGIRVSGSSNALLQELAVSPGRR